MQKRGESEAGTFRELLIIYKNLRIKTKQGRRWTKWDRVFFQFGLSIIAAFLIISISIVVLLNN